MFKNLFYTCVHLQKKYIDMFFLLYCSLKKFNKNENYDILILCDNMTEIYLKEIFKEQNNIFYYKLDCNSVFDAAANKLKIYEYPRIDQYLNIVYLDSDIIVCKDITFLFDLSNDNYLCAVSQDFDINHLDFSLNLYDKKTLDKINDKKPANSGFYIMKNNSYIKQLFWAMNDLIHTYKQNKTELPACLEQPFFNHILYTFNYINVDILSNYLEFNVLNIDDLKRDTILIHFCGGPGTYWSKLPKMIEISQQLKL